MAQLSQAKQMGNNVKPNTGNNQPLRITSSNNAAKNKLAGNNKISNNQLLRITSSNNAAKNKLAGNLGINIQTLNKLTKIIENNTSKRNITTKAILNYIVEARKTNGRLKFYSLNSNQNIEQTVKRAINNKIKKNERNAIRQNKSNNNNYGSTQRKVRF